MIRMIGAFAALLAFLPVVTASLDRQKAASRPGEMRFADIQEIRLDIAEVTPPAEAQLTAETEVLLDGRRCTFKDVPATAAITRMVLTSDGRTIARIEFRTAK